MARISGVELSENRKVLYSLPIIFGIGHSLAEKIIEEAGIPIDKRVKDLSEEEISKLQKEVEKYPIEGELRRSISQNIKRLEEIGAYRGLRHKKNLPAHGQRTRSNARTKRGKRQTVGAIKKEFKARQVKATEEKK